MIHPPINIKGSYRSIVEGLQLSNKDVSLPKDQLIMEMNKHILRQYTTLINIFEYKQASLSVWRTLYETVVFTRLITQIKDSSIIEEVVERYFDNKEMERGKLNNFNTYDLYNKYKDKEKHLDMTNTYDWLNPIMTKNELIKLNNKYHPSFKDLVSRTYEKEALLSHYYTYYQHSSLIVHTNPMSDEVLDMYDVDKISEITVDVVKLYIIDILDYIISQKDLPSQMNIYTMKLKEKLFN